MHHRLHDQPGGGEGGLSPSGPLLRGRGALPPGGSPFRGSASRGVCLQGGHIQGECLPHGVWADPPPELEKRAGRILLECFLVDYLQWCPSGEHVKTSAYYRQQ